jgi:hypothetical protein
MTRLFWARFRRWWMSASSVLAVGLPVAALFGAAKDLNLLGTIGATSGSAGFTGFPLPIVFWGIVLFIGFLLALRAYSEYQQRTYDQTWISTFRSDFNSESMKQVRNLAASVLMERKGELRSEDRYLANIDDVLDFF